MQNLQRRTWAEVDLDCIRHNFFEIKKHTDAKICCVIKADAYGHGAVELAKEYENAGAYYFAVSNLDEALQLRNAKITTPILVFGYVPITDVSVLAENNITQCVYSLDYAEKLSSECVKQNVEIKVHIKIDTGMSRLGFLYQNPDTDFNSIDEIHSACKSKGLKAEGIFTHFAMADEGKDDNTLKQLSSFNDLISKLDIKFKIVHASNSGAIEDFSVAHLDMVRAGIILYGLSPSSSIRNNFDLKPALSLKSVISHVKHIKKGSGVSYGHDFHAEKDMLVATVPIGYADGYSRVLANSGHLLVNGKRRKIIGRICMDQLMIDLEDDTSVRIGDIVTVIGVDGNEQISTDEIAELRGTINYEVVCDIGARVPRFYIKNGIEVASQNYIIM